MGTAIAIGIGCVMGTAVAMGTAGSIGTACAMGTASGCAFGHIVCNRKRLFVDGREPGPQK